MGLWLYLRCHFHVNRLLGSIKDNVIYIATRAAAIGPRRRRRRPPGIRLAVLLTASRSRALPREKHVQAIVHAGTGSRACVSRSVSTLAARLRGARTWSVAVKCLLVLHQGLRQGGGAGFMFQDQAAALLLPSPAHGGGRNCLNLSAFHDPSAGTYRGLSLWVRWYARYLEHWLLTCRVLGYFMDTATLVATSNSFQALPTKHLSEQALSLYALQQEACSCRTDPEALRERLVQSCLALVVDDALWINLELSVRIEEASQRLTSPDGDAAPPPVPSPCLRRSLCPPHPPYRNGSGKGGGP